MDYITVFTQIINVTKTMFMESQKFCQSFTLPIDKIEDRGTEKYGSASTLYCKYCYQHGAFTDPSMTIEKMKKIINTEMKKQDLPANLVEQSLLMLPGLKRWKVS